MLLEAAKMHAATIMQSQWFHQCQIARMQPSQMHAVGTYTRSSLPC
jgi:hypothetical protein